MPKDRLKDLRQATSWPNVSYEGLKEQFPNHDGQNATNNPCTKIDLDKESKIIQFLNETEVIRTIIDRIDELAQQVKKIHIALLQPIADPKLEQELDEKTDEIKSLSYEISAKLKKLEQLKAHQGDYDITSAQWRIKESQIFVLTRRFRDTMVEYNKESVVHRERCKKIIVRELELSGNRRPYDELDDMLDHGYSGTFSIPIMIETQKAQERLHEIEARHRDMIKLEKSIEELHNMFLDLAILVTDQGEMVDSIEHNVFKAEEYVEDAAENVYITEQYNKKALKKKLILVLILSLVVISILIFILVSYLIQKKIKRG